MALLFFFEFIVFLFASDLNGNLNFTELKTDWK